MRAFGIQPVVAINTRPDDEPELLELIKERSLEAGAFGAAIHNGFGQGGEGTIELAEVVVAAADADSDFRMLYADDDPIATKIEKVAKTVYGADGIELAPAARDAIARYEKQGLAQLPICMAKTHLSLSHDPTQRNRPTGFTVPIRDIRVYSGAGMLVPLCGEMLQMPGLRQGARGLRDRHRRRRVDGGACSDPCLRAGEPRERLPRRNGVVPGASSGP